MTPDAPLVRYGMIAGAERAGAIYPVSERGTVDRERSAPVTIDGAIDALTKEGARFALAELPETLDMAPTSDALLAHGFSEVGRVANFVDDAVDLRLLVLPLSTPVRPFGLRSQCALRRCSTTTPLWCRVHSDDVARRFGNAHTPVSFRPCAARLAMPRK